MTVVSVLPPLLYEGPEFLDLKPVHTDDDSFALYVWIIFQWCCPKVIVCQLVLVWRPILCIPLFACFFPQFSLFVFPAAISRHFLSSSFSTCIHSHRKPKLLCWLFKPIKVFTTTTVLPLWVHTNITHTFLCFMFCSLCNFISLSTFQSFIFVVLPAFLPTVPVPLFQSALAHSLFPLITHSYLYASMSFFHLCLDPAGVSGQDAGPVAVPHPVQSCVKHVASDSA